MLLLPTLLSVFGAITGAGGLTISVKGIADLLDAAATNRAAQEENEERLMRFESVSDNLNLSLESLGKQRMIISKNFKVFASNFEKIHNKPSFSTGEDINLPEFNFDEIKNISVVADSIMGATLGAIGGSVFASAAAAGTTAAVMAFGTASTGTAISSLSGAAATKAALAALGGGAIKVGGGGIALGTLVLNAASLGVAVLVEGIAIAWAGSMSKKQADKAHEQMEKNRKVIQDAIDMQLDINHSVNEIKKVSIDICNNVYKPYVMKFKELVANKNDWNLYTDDEKLLVENNIRIVQVLHFLNNIPLYKVINTNDAGEVDQVESNSSEVKEAINKANESINKVR